MEQKKYTLAEAARILGELFNNMANSLEVNEETCSPEYEKCCLEKCDSDDKCKNHHNDSPLDVIVSCIVEAFNKIYNEKQKYYEMTEKLRTDLDNVHRYIENFCKNESDYSNPDNEEKKDEEHKCVQDFVTSGIDAKNLKEDVQMVNDIKINFIKKLSEETGYGLINCKKALIECDYDYDKAKQYLMEDKLGIASILT